MNHSPTQLPEDLHPKTKRIIEMLLEKDPKKRPDA